MLLLVPYNSVYYNYIIITQWLVGWLVLGQGKKGVHIGKKVHCGPVIEILRKYVLWFRLQNLLMKLHLYAYMLFHNSLALYTYTPDDGLVFTDSGAQGSDKGEVSPHPSPIVLSKEFTYIQYCI